MLEVKRPGNGITPGQLNKIIFIRKILKNMKLLKQVFEKEKNSMKI